MGDLRKLIGKQLRNIRKSKGLTQEEVADRIAESYEGREGFNKSRVSKIETGNANINLSTLELIMAVLGVTPFELFEFNKHLASTDYTDKKMLIDAHRITLMERPLNEVKYIVGAANDFLNAIEDREEKNNE